MIRLNPFLPQGIGLLLIAVAWFLMGVRLESIWTAGVFVILLEVSLVVLARAHRVRSFIYWVTSWFFLGIAILVVFQPLVMSISLESGPYFLMFIGEVLFFAGAMWVRSRIERKKW